MWHERLLEIMSSQSYPSEERFSAQQEAMMYIASYLAFRLKTHQHFVGQILQKSWISEISTGHLFYPSKELLNLVNEFKLVFCLFHGKELDRKSGIIKIFFEVLKYSQCSGEFLKTYCRTRTFFALSILKKLYE